jgi:hypothetical protein
MNKIIQSYFWNHMIWSWLEVFSRALSFQNGKTRRYSLFLNPTPETKIIFQDPFPVPIYYIKLHPRQSNMKLTTLSLLLFLSIVGTSLALAPSLPTALSNPASSPLNPEITSFEESSKRSNINITEVVVCVIVGFCLLLGLGAFLFCQLAA